ncbi:MAG: DUF354 domain-containing protein [Candidatus Delongbacteria bacterium]|nr:DUF354 domain-containing protein [Candidatus Delongbacteria bacterium]MBN2834320.1 DUF354 domain-containing protein [Candidatus Delongbacteria bacterium]
MKILIDIGHPAHVHYFRNFIKIMESRGHKFKVIARKREIIFELLSHYGIKFHNRGRGSDSFIGKIVYMFFADILIFIKALRFKPDLFLSFSSPYAAQVSYLFRKPHIALNDTEHTDKTHSKFTYPFSANLITPKSYTNDIGEKHIRFNNIIESLYLHKTYFQPDKDIYKFLGIKENEEYVILRFVSWNAHHDFGQQGLSKKDKEELISILKVKFKVFISSEGKLEESLKQYQIKIPPYKMHDVLANASLFIGESGTMASESAVLGTYAVYINSLPLMCYLRLEQENNLLKHFSSTEDVVEYVRNLIQRNDLKEEALKNRDMMTKDFIDPTAFLIWFIENYPESVKFMKDNPDYQNKFKI